MGSLVVGFAVGAFVGARVVGALVVGAPVGASVVGAAVGAELVGAVGAFVGAVVVGASVVGVPVVAGAVGEAVDEGLATCSSVLPLGVRLLVTLLASALANRSSITRALLPWYFSSSVAATPATCGVATTNEETKQEQRLARSESNTSRTS